jgi:hypothetical protein
MKHLLIPILCFLALNTYSQQYQFSYGLNLIRLSPQKEKFTYQPLQRPAYEVTTPNVYSNRFGLSLHYRRTLKEFEGLKSALNFSTPTTISGFYQVTFTNGRTYSDPRNNIWLSLPLLMEWYIGDGAGSISDVYHGFGGFIGVGMETIVAKVYGEEPVIQLFPYASLGLSYKVNNRLKIFCQYGRNFLPIYEAVEGDYLVGTLIENEGIPVLSSVRIDRTAPFQAHTFSITISYRRKK